MKGRGPNPKISRRRTRFSSFSCRTKPTTVLLLLLGPCHLNSTHWTAALFKFKFKIDAHLHLVLRRHAAAPASGNCLICSPASTLQLLRGGVLAHGRPLTPPRRAPRGNGRRRRRSRRQRGRHEGAGPDADVGRGRRLRCHRRGIHPPRGPPPPPRAGSPAPNHPLPPHRSLSRSHDNFYLSASFVFLR